MTVELAPAARSQFAKRLKAIRTQRGFERARYFAETLGIEENRYTRYERAEVEPSLTLLHKICETLRITPDQLLGFSDLEGGEPLVPLAGMAESPQRTPAPGALSGTIKAHPKDTLAWRLAAEVETIHRGKTKAGREDTFARLRDTGTLYQALQTDPFGTVANILSDPALEDAGEDDRAELARLVEAFTQSVS